MDNVLIVEFKSFLCVLSNLLVWGPIWQSGGNLPWKKQSKKWKGFEEIKPCLQRTTSYEMLDYLKLKLQHFVKHNFVVQWEDKQFKAWLKSFPKDNIVLVVDFVENYYFEIQNLVQNMVFIPNQHINTHLLSS